MNDHLIQPPLSQAWERAAMKELCDISYFLTHGMIETPEELRDRLRYAADAVIQTEQIYSNSLPPSTRPEINALTRQAAIDDQIQYEIIAGRCSYCGHETEMIELPDGTVDFSDRCHHCDQYSLEILAESVE